MLTMNLAPGKSDLRFKWIFIQKHRRYWEIITADGSYVSNKRPWCKLLSRERIHPAASFPSGFSQLHLPGLSLLPSILSLLRWKCPAISVPHWDFLHHWPIIPYVYYKIILLHSQRTREVLISPCISRCLLPLLWDGNKDTSESDFSWL